MYSLQAMKTQVIFEGGGVDKSFFKSNIPLKDQVSQSLFVSIEDIDKKGF